MLKFTKYGKKASKPEVATTALTCSSTSGTETSDSGTVPTENLPSVHGRGDNDARISDAASTLNSNELRKGFGESHVAENASTTTTVMKGSLLNQPKQNPPEKDTLDPSFNFTKPLNPHPSPLKLCKLPKDELMKMDSEMKFESSYKTLGKRTRFTTKGIDDNRSNMKISRPSMVTLKNALDLQSSIKIPVFNDGYFPKIHPLNKLFSLKRAK